MANKFKIYRVELRNKSFQLIKVLTKVADSLSWDWDRIGGCGRCSLNLPVDSEYLDNIAPDYDIQVHLGNNVGGDNLVYRGFIDTYQTTIGRPDKVQLKAFGYINQLKRIRVNTTYTSQSISDIVKDILDNYIVPNTSITYDADDIDNISYTPDSLEFDELADSAMSTLADLGSGIEWGVDKNLKFFFKQESTNINHYLRYGKEIEVFNSMNDYSQIKNRLIIKGGGDLEVTVNNTESQSAYGIRTKIISNSAITTNSVAQQYGTSLLAELARISRRATIKLTNSDKYFESNIPLGQINLLASEIAQAKKYGDDDAIYGAFKYGGQPAIQINSIKYSLRNEALDININAGQAVPDVYKQIKQLQYDVEQLRNA